MVSLSLTNSNPRIKFSDRLYFDKYRYCLRMNMPWVECVRFLDHDRIDYLLEIWDTHAWYDRKINKGGTWKIRHRRTLVSEDKQKLHRLCDWLTERQGTIKQQFVKGKVFVYSNNEEELERLKQDIDPEIFLMSEVIIDRPQNTVKSRYPGFEVRAYLKAKSMSITEKRTFMKFIDQNMWHIRLNVGLERFVTNNSTRLRDYFFIDFHDKKLLSILELMVPGTIRKTMDIIYDDK